MILLHIMERVLYLYVWMDLEVRRYLNIKLVRYLPVFMLTYLNMSKLSRFSTSFFISVDVCGCLLSPHVVIELLRIRSW